MKTRLALVLAIAIPVSLVIFDMQHRQATSTEVQAGATMQLESTSFSNNGSIPSQFTCDGAGVSPNLKWSGAPEGTRSFALVVHDPDAPVDFTHWLAYNIPPNIHQLAEGASTDMPGGAAEGTNSFRKVGFGGPCPPAGKPHHYIFLIYALDTKLDMPAGASRQQVESAMKGHILASGRLVGTYQRAR